MAGVATVFALVPNGIKKELAAKGTQDELIELSLYEFMAVHLMYFILAFAHGTLTAKASIDRPFPDILLDYATW